MLRKLPGPQDHINEDHMIKTHLSAHKSIQNRNMIDKAKMGDSTWNKVSLC